MVMEPVGILTEWLGGALLLMGGIDPTGFSTLFGLVTTIATW
jgi:hypothetical protein